MKIELATGSDDEQRASEVLASLVVQHQPAVDRFLYTDTVRLDTGADSPYSHPILTITPSHVLGPPLVALTVLVHENMHWANRVLPGCAGIVDEARQRWPQPPAAADGGGRDAFSTWLHVCVCALELAAMCDLVGEDEARATIGSVNWYRWIYALLLGDELPFQDVLARHHVELPPVPPTRLAPLDALRSLGEGYSAAALMPAIETRLEPWALAPTVGDDLASALDVELDPWREVDIAPARLAAVVAMTALTYAALVRLAGADAAIAAGASHGRNAEVYAVMAERGEKILARIAPASAEAAAFVDWSRHG